MSPQEKVKLARWFNARGIRMMKCAGHVESCGHYKAFRELALAKFEERGRLMECARVELGKRKQFVFEIVDGPHLWSEIKAIATGYDELSAGAKFEDRLESLGLPVCAYFVRRIKRARGHQYILGSML